MAKTENHMMMVLESRSVLTCVYPEFANGHLRTAQPHHGEANGHYSGMIPSSIPEDTVILRNCGTQQNEASARYGPGVLDRNNSTFPTGYNPLNSYHCPVLTFFVRVTPLEHKLATLRRAWALEQ